MAADDPGPPRPSDREPSIATYGTGDVAASVVSMSSRHPGGEDAAYLRWHVLDHLPEQHRIAGVRQGQRWVSTPACRAARSASVGPYDAVDHLVQYLLAEPVAPALDAFFPLGGALWRIGRMPMVLPRVQVGGWSLAHAVAADRVLVGAAVLPWRPASGAYVLVEQHETATADAASARGVPDMVTALLDVPGVAGAWRWLGSEPRHDRLESTAGLTLTICYLDDDPVAVAGEIGAVLAAGAADADRVTVLAAPFQAVVPGAWDRHLP